MKLKLAYSTCPNDTYMFEAIANQRIDLKGIQFDIHLADIEELNKMALAGIHDVTKLSYTAFSKVWDKYSLLTSGSAIGHNNGPLLISKSKVYPDEINDISVAIPGHNTTANLLLEILHPDIKEKKEYLFSDIEDAILSGEVDAGLIIHETRFSFEKKGLKKIIDLGEEWHKDTGLLIPLGGIAIKNSLPDEVKKNVSGILKESINFAIQNPSAGYPYIKHHAQETSEETIYKHIQLYVNDFSLDLGETGKNSIKQFFILASEKKLCGAPPEDIFFE